MSRKSEFWDWVRANEKVAPQEEKELKKAYKQAHLRMHLYDLDNADAVRRADVDGRLELYCEFLIGAKGAANNLAHEKKRQSQVREVIEQTSTSKERYAVADIPTQEKSTEALQDNGDAERENAPSVPKADAYEYIFSESERLSAIMHLSDDRTESEQEADVCRYAYDIATACCCNATTKTVRPLTAFVVYKEKLTETQKIEACREDAFYYSRGGHTLFGTAAVLRDGDADIIPRVIQHTAQAYGDLQSSVQKAVCIMPDTLGEFGDSVKRQVNSLGGKYVAVPRSVIAAYSYIKSHAGCQDIRVIDLDLPVPDDTHIRISQDEENGLVVTRMQRRKNLNWGKYSLVVLARQYITEYARANGFSLDSVVAENLLRTGDAFRVMRNECNILVEASNGQYKTLGYSQEILRIVLRAVTALIESTKKGIGDGSANVVFLLSVGAGINGVMTISDTFDGITEILRRIDARQVIWKEYLPELSLEVIKNGRFDKLWLIKKESERSIAVMESEDRITVPIDEGIFTFPPHVKEVLLPLEREEFGNTVKDKKAKFSSKQLPLSESLEVELSLSYSYGDPDSYKLTARGATSPDFVIESEWCDEDAAVKVVWPQYNGNKQIALEDEEINWLQVSFEHLEKRIERIVNGREWKYPLRASTLNDNGEESNLFQAMNRNDKLYYLAPVNIIKRISETVNTENPEYYRVLCEIIYSDTFADLVNFIVAPQYSELYQYIEEDVADKKLCKHVERSILRYLCQWGSFYKNGYFDDVDSAVSGLIDRFVLEKNGEYLVCTSRCISGNSDIMDAIIRKIDEVDNRVVRNVASVCWYNAEWIKNLYDADLRVNGGVKKVISSMEDYIIDYLLKSALKEITEKTLKVRDTMEAALALCRLRQYDETIFDSNTPRVRELVGVIKEIDHVVQEKKLYKKFVSRVCHDQQQQREIGLFNMSVPCYLLISQLSGMQNLQLLGFKEE